MAGEVQASWRVDYPADQEPFNDSDQPTIVTVQLMPGAMILGNMIMIGHSQTLHHSPLTLRLNLKQPNWRKSGAYLKCFRKRRYPVICDEVPSIVALFADEKGWLVEFSVS